MGELKKLFQVKRILAMVLAAAMTITSLPATALAAEPVDTSTVTEADAEDTSAQSNTEIETEGEQTSQLLAETPGDVVDDTETVDQPAADDADQSNQVAAADAGQDSGDSMQTQAEGDTAGGATVAELGTSEIGGKDLGDEYSADGNSPIADTTGKKLSTGFLSNYRLTVNDGTNNVKTVSLDDLTDPIVATVTYQWFTGDSALGDVKKLAEEGSLPVDAGDYTLKLVLPAKENEYEGAEASFSYEISKSEVNFYIDEPISVAAGTKWTDVPVPEIYYLSANNGKGFTYRTDNPETEANEAADNEVAFTVVIKDAATGVALKDDETLVKNGEYVLSVVPEFIGDNKDKYEKNYTWAHCEEKKVAIGELKATRLTLTPDPTYGAKAAAVANDDNERTVQIIKAESFTKELQELKYELKLETEDGVDEQDKPKWKTIEGETAGAWYTAASYSNPWTEGTKTYCNLTLGSKMDTVPETTGAYVYRVCYEGDQKEYAGCYADILVIIDAVEIIVRPTVSEQIVFYDGELVSDVLSQITYVLPYADGRTDTKGEPALYLQTDYMWGTSYEPSGVTQPYKPDFELIEIVKDEDGKEINRRTYTSSNSSATLALGNDYIVRFNGKKNVYTAGGSASLRTGINEQVDSMDPATCGFRVKTDTDTLEAEVNTVKIEVVKKDKEIDVTEIEKAATEKAKMTKETVGALEDAYTKTYDGSRIFDLYADFMKAKLTSGISDPVKDFTYQWQESYYYTYEDLLGMHKETVDGQETDMPDVSKEDLEDNDNWVDTSVISPANAGVYRLKITYKSSRVKGYAEPAYVYFVIKKQEITLTFDENTTLTGNVGNNITAFTTNHANKINEATTLIPSKDQPAKAEDWKNAALLSTSADYAYEVTWSFYTKEKETVDGQETDKLDENGKPVYSRYGGTLQSTREYFLGARLIKLGSYDSANGFAGSSNNPNYDVKNEFYIPITVKEMGTDIIKFDGITTTGGQEIEKTKTYDGKSIYDLIKDDLETLNTPIIVKTDESTNAETKESVTFAQEEEYRLTYVIQGSNGGAETYDTLPTDEESWAWTKNGGSYRISAQFAGNEWYAPLYSTELARITVTPMEMVLTIPTLTEEFEAGQKASEVITAAEREFNQQATVSVKAKKADETIPTADMEKYFTKVERNGRTGFLAWYDEYYDYFSVPYMAIHDSVDDYDYTSDDDCLLQGTGDKRYSLRLEGNYFENRDCYYNYVITDIEPVDGTPIKVVRGASTVTMDEYSLSDNKKTTKVDITDNISTPKEVVGSIVKEHIVTIQDGIAYSNGSPEGNIVAIAIQAPAEYNEAYLDWDKVGYEQSIKNAAGDRLIGSVTANEQYNNIIFTYNATALDETDKKDLEFCIRWEEDYSEKFILKFSEATLLGNLQEAVAPKSLAFNGAPKTMVVGQDQALDVKITKVQNADIICLGYEVTTDKDKMHVDEFGKVTALAEGKATVEVYPMHLVDGKKERIPGAKSAKTTITVKKVSAPKITKVTAKDTSITVEYTMLNGNDGYRREIYVVEGKNIKANVIEQKVTDEMKNEQWQGVFAVAPRFVSYSDELTSRAYDYKKGSYANTARATISGLDPQKDYTVYVRNVSAVRSFADDCQVSLSVAGTAKGCKTSTILMEDIAAVLKDEEIKEIDDDNVYSTPTQDEIWNADVIGYEVPLTKKNVQISLEGLFTDTLGDSVYAPIPLAGQDLKNLKSKYAAPKITYYFYDYIYDGYDALYGYRRFETSGYTKTSSIATINNKGKVTLKQPGEVTIYAVDTVSGAKSNAVRIYVTAEADSIAAKNTTMEIGQRISLRSLVVYKQGKTVLNNYSGYDRIDVKAAQESLKSAGKENSFSISDEGYLTAYAKDSVKLTLQDTILGKSVTVNVKAKDLSPVKNLKAVNVIDNRFDVQFEMNPYAEAYRIEIMDAKKVIRSIYVENIPLSFAPETWNSYSGKWVHDSSYRDDDWGTGTWGNVSSNEHYSEHWYRGDNAFCRADKTNGKWVLTYRIQKLTQASKYNISVTALYKDVKSKTVKKAATTTKLPAYDYALTGKIVAGTRYDAGMPITTRSGNSIGVFNFVSGNTYSLQAAGAKQNALIAGTDTLTWTSSNKKVATVQANSGGYGATLKALKDGETVIEVKSKVLKALVARVTISVSTVGDAYKGRDYYGDNEDLRGNGSTKPNAVTELIVGVAEPVELSAGQSKTFKVTLTEEGQYTAYQVTNGSENRWGSARSVNSSNTPYTWNLGTISGEFTGSVIVKKTGNVGSNTIKNRTVIQPGETVTQIQSGAWYVFTAPKDGLYGVTANGISNYSVFNVYKQSAEQDAELNTSYSETQKYFYELKKDEVVYLKANGYYSEVKIAGAKFEPLTLEGAATVSGGSEKWFKFTSGAQDQYEFTIVPGNYWSEFAVYTAEFVEKNGGSTNTGHDANGNYYYTYTYEFGKSEEVYIRFYNDNSTTANISVKKKESFREFDENGKYTINREFTGSSDYLYISYTVPTDGFYTFSSEAVAGASGTKGYGYLEVDGSQKGSTMYIGSTDGTTGKYYLTKGQSVCVRVRSINYPEIWEGVVVKAEKTGDAPAEITVGSEAESVAIPAGESVWYSFTADEAAYYVVTFPKITDDSDSIGAYLYENVTDDYPVEDMNVTLSSGAYRTISVGAGETRYLKITNDNSAVKEFQVKIQKVPADDVVVTEENPVDLVLDGEQWVSFTADEEACYVFDIIDNTSSGLNYIYAYEDKTDNNSTFSIGAISIVLNKEQKIWLKVYGKNKGDVLPNQLTVSKETFGKANAEGTISNLNVIDVGPDDHYAVVKFTANADGKYTFKGTDANIKSLYVYKNYALKGTYSDKSEIIETGDGGSRSCIVSSYTMDAGDIVYLKINLKTTSTDLSLTVSKDADE